MRALFVVHAPEEEEVVAEMRLARIVLEVERVGDVRDPVQVRLRPALVHRDRDQPDLGRDLLDAPVDEARVAVERPVDRVHDRRLGDAAEHRAQVARVVVDDVELVRAVVAGEDVAQLGEGAADQLARRVLEDRLELRLGV